MSARTQSVSDIARRGFEEFVEQGKLDNAEELLSPNFRGHYSGFPPVNGIEEFKQVIMLWTSAFSDRTDTFDDVVEQGDKLAIRHTFVGTHTGDLNGIPPTGKRVTLQGIDIMRFEDGKLAEHWAINDGMSLMQQLGLIPGPGQPS